MFTKVDEYKLTKNGTEYAYVSLFIYALTSELKAEIELKNGNKFQINLFKGENVEKFKLRIQKEIQQRLNYTNIEEKSYFSESRKSDEYLLHKLKNMKINGKFATKKTELDKNYKKEAYGYLKIKRPKDYLYESGIFSDEILREDSNVDYSKILDDVNLDNYQKEVLEYFIIPNRISILKISLNEEYFKDEFPVDFLYRHKHISPSLIKIKEYFDSEYPFYFMKGGRNLTKGLNLGNNVFINILSYPKWFYHSFPDIAYWIFLESGGSVLEMKYDSNKELLTDKIGEINLDLLKEIVDSFLHLKGYFECSTIDFKNFNNYI